MRKLIALGLALIVLASNTHTCATDLVATTATSNVGKRVEATDSITSLREIPGWIVYSDSKNAILLNLKTGEKFNLTALEKGAVVQSPLFTVSKDGKWLLWFQDSKFWVKELPLGGAIAVKAVPFEKKGNSLMANMNKTFDLVFPPEAKMRNLSISDDGTKFSFESAYTATSWVLIDQGNPTALAKMMAAGQYANFATSDPTKKDLRFDVLPLYAKRPVTINGIFCLNTLRNRFNPPEESPFNPLFGSVAINCPAPLFKATPQDSGAEVTPNSMWRPLGHGLIGNWQTGGENSTTGRFYETTTKNKNAHFLAWWQNRADFIYQVDGKFGCIQIRTFDEERDSIDVYKEGVGFLKDHIPEGWTGSARELEAQVVIPGEVTGMARTPNGSLSVFTSQGNVFMISSVEIQNAFKNSGVEQVKDSVDKRFVHFRPVNNVFQPKLELVATGVVGSCFYWVTDESVLFLGQDGSVYFGSQGTIRKVLDGIGYFCWTASSPFEGMKDTSLFAETPSLATPKSNTQKVIKDTSKVVNCFDEPTIVTGHIRVSWGLRDKNSIYINLDGPDGPLQYSLLKTDNLDEDDPAQLEYSSSQIRDGYVTKKVGGKDSTVRKDAIEQKNVILGVGRAIALKPEGGTECLKIALKSAKEGKDGKKDEIEIDKNYYPQVDFPKEVARKPFVKKPFAKKVAGKLAEEDGWQISAVEVGKEFKIGDIAFTWEPVEKKSGKKRKLAPGEVEVSTKFMLRYISTSGLPIRISSDWDNESVFNPLSYKFGGEGRTSFGIGFIQSYFLILEMGNDYVTIIPIEERKGKSGETSWVQYKWKYWPNLKKPGQLASAGR